MIWQIKEQKALDLVEQLLINRGLKKKEDIEAFFTPKIEYFQKQIQLPGITKTLKRIDQAIEKQELIIVYGDYDVDGVCASAIMYKSLTAFGVS